MRLVIAALLLAGCASPSPDADMVGSPAPAPQQDWVLPCDDDPCIQTTPVSDPLEPINGRFGDTAAHPDEPWIAVATVHEKLARYFVPGDGARWEPRIWTSHDAGETWTVSVPPFREALPGGDPAGGQTYLWTHSSGILDAFIGAYRDGPEAMVHVRSADWGKTWKTLGVYDDLYGVDAVAAAPDDPDRLFMAVRPHERPFFGDVNAVLMRSDDGGATWIRVGGLPCPAPEATFAADLLEMKVLGDRLLVPCRNGSDEEPHREVAVARNGTMEIVEDGPGSCGYTRVLPWRDANVTFRAASTATIGTCADLEIQLPSGAFADFGAVAWQWRDHDVGIDAFHMDPAGGIHIAAAETDHLPGCGGCRGLALHALGFASDGSLAYQESIGTSLAGLPDRVALSEYPNACTSARLPEGAAFSCPSDQHLYFWTVGPA